MTKPTDVMRSLAEQGLRNFNPKRKTGRTTRIACLALILSKDGGDVVIVVANTLDLDHMAALLTEAAGDYLEGARVHRDSGVGFGRDCLVFEPIQGGQLRIQTDNMSVGKHHHVLVDHVTRGEM